MKSALCLGVCLLAAPLSVAQTQEAKLNASNGAAADQYGYSVSISGDTAIVGAHLQNGVGIDSGSAYVYVGSGSSWPQQAILTAGDAAAGDEFGYAAAVDGDTAIVGARRDNTGTGAAYVFVRSGTVWSQQAKLSASDGVADDEFGFSVALDGNTAVVGARFDDDNGFGSGSAYVFTRIGTSWVQQAKLTPADGAPDDEFGFSVAVDGETAVVGSYLDDDGGSGAGSAYAFLRTGGTWNQQQKLVASGPGANDWFGYAVSLSGNTAIIGAIFDDDLGGNSGSAYVFDRSGAVWSQAAKLNASDGIGGDLFGFSVAISSNSAVVGAIGPGGAGSAYSYVRIGSLWLESAILTALDGTVGDQFGFAVDVDDDTAVIGARFDDDLGFDSGSAYVFGSPLGFMSCFGVGCPCGNDDATAGCANSTGVGGLMTGSGSTSVSAADLTLTATQLPRLNNGLYYMGDAVVTNPFFDGLQCALGNTFRFLSSIQNSGDEGIMTYGSFVTDAVGLITAGSTWHFHAWHRDFPGSPCVTGANLTAMYSVTFTP